MTIKFDANGSSVQTRELKGKLKELSIAVRSLKLQEAYALTEQMDEILQDLRNDINAEQARLKADASAEIMGEWKDGQPLCGAFNEKVCHVELKVGAKVYRSQIGLLYCSKECLDRCTS